MTEKAVILLSGGLDSCACLAGASEEGFECHALSFRYGQRHSRELECAAKIAEWYNIPHTIMDISLPKLSRSALTDLSKDLPDRDLEHMQTIPDTWVPQRNSIFLACAYALAESVGAQYVFIGANQVDYSGYPDCREEFLSCMSKALNRGSKQYVEGTGKIGLKAPLIDMTKGDIVLTGIEYGAPLHLTTSCYNGEEEACGTCDSCKLRLAGFEEAGQIDPIKYKREEF